MKWTKYTFPKCLQELGKREIILNYNFNIQDHFNHLNILNHWDEI